VERGLKVPLKPSALAKTPKLQSKVAPTKTKAKKRQQQIKPQFKVAPPKAKAKKPATQAKTPKMQFEFTPEKSRGAPNSSTVQPTLPVKNDPLISPRSPRNN